MSLCTLQTRIAVSDVEGVRFESNDIFEHSAGMGSLSIRKLHLKSQRLGPRFLSEAQLGGIECRGVPAWLAIAESKQSMNIHLIHRHKTCAAASIDLQSKTKYRRYVHPEILSNRL